MHNSNCKIAIVRGYFLNFKFFILLKNADIIAIHRELS